MTKQNIIDILMKHTSISFKNEEGKIECWIDKSYYYLMAEDILKLWTDPPKKCIVFDCKNRVEYKIYATDEKFHNRPYETLYCKEHFLNKVEHSDGEMKVIKLLPHEK